MFFTFSCRGSYGKARSYFKPKLAQRYINHAYSKCDTLFVQGSIYQSLHFFQYSRLLIVLMNKNLL